MEKRHHKKGKRILIFFFVLGGIFLFFCMYNRIKTINVKGCEYYSEDEIKQNLLTGVEGKNSILLYLKARYIGLKELPYIEKVTIKRVNHHEITIHVYEKELIACVKYMSQYLYFDKDGVILDTSDEERDGIPCISGLTFSGFKIYEPIEVEEKDIFTSILDISQIINRYELDIDKIHFNSKNEVSLGVGMIQIYLGKREFYDEPIVALSEILPTVLERKLKGTINMENYQTGDNIIFHLQTKKK
ncbi:MAG: cell division protein FtsQ/DivIB [Velocimicrobium sp.]